MLQKLFQNRIPTRQQLLHKIKTKTHITSPILITQYHPFITHHKTTITNKLTLPKNITTKYPHLPSSKPIIAFKNNSNIFKLYKQLRKQHIQTLDLLR